DQLKEGATVTVLSDKDGKVTELHVGEAKKPEKAPKGQQVAGKIKKLDAAAGTLTVAVQLKKGETQDRECKLGDAKVVVFDGKEKKELTAKDGLKNEHVKEGAAVTVLSDREGKVTAVQVGQPAAKKPEKGEKGRQVAGKIKKVDAAASVLVVTVKV